MNRTLYMSWCAWLVLGAACGGGGGGGMNGGDDAGGDAPRFSTDGNGHFGTGPTLGGCPVLPDDHIFNTKIDSLPVDLANSDAFITTIGGTRKLHLDLGQIVDQQDPNFFGIPYNVAAESAQTWPTVAYTSPDTQNLDWDPKPESDCADGSHSIVSPCDSIATPHLPFPASPLVEGGISTATDHLPYGDHHLLVLDTDSCLLWEAYHVYRPNNAWEIFGSAVWDLHSNNLRPVTWSSADAAGFPILPLLLKAEEASSGEIKHALRFTILTSKIRGTYSWPATHESSTGSMTSQPPYGTLLRLKASYQIPTSFNTQSKAILTAMKTYGMYLADGGSDMFITGTASADWLDSTFTEVQMVPTSQFEAVDLSPIKARTGWSATSAAAPPP